MATAKSLDRDGIRALLAAIERQAREAVSLGKRATRDMTADRFASYLDFRRKVEEVRALATLTEDRLRSGEDPRLDDLRIEFDRLEVLLTGMLASATRSYFASMREDQNLPVGAREMFEPELRIIDALRQKLSGRRYAGRIPAAVMDDLDATAAVINRLLHRAPKLPDFSDTPSPTRAARRLRPLHRPSR